MCEILFLAHRVPYPPDRGDRMRSFHLLRLLADLAHVHLAAFADSAEEEAAGEALGPLLASRRFVRRDRSTVAAGLAALASGRPISLAAFDAPAMHAHVRDVLATRPIEAIFAFSGQMAQFVPAGFAGRFVMDFVDMDSAKFAAYADTAHWPMRAVHRREAARLGAFERVVAERADVSLFVSDAEAALFRAATGLGRIAVIENGIDLARYEPAGDFVRPAPAPGPLIVFTGQMDYRPNVAAVVDFATHSWPAVRARFPQARFAIVGRDPDPAVRRLAGDGVIVTGAVSDVRGWIAAADAVVAPLRLARGVQNKVLEAMALARPVVASPAAFEGIVATRGREIVVADRDGEADALIALLEDRPRAEAIGRAARARIEAHYGWDSRRAQLATLMGFAPRALGAAA